MSNESRNPADDGGCSWGSVTVRLPDGTILRSQAEAEAYALACDPSLAEALMGADPDVEALTELEAAELAASSKAVKRARGRKTR